MARKARGVDVGRDFANRLCCAMVVRGYQRRQGALIAALKEAGLEISRTTLDGWMRGRIAHRPEAAIPYLAEVLGQEKAYWYGFAELNWDVEPVNFSLSPVEGDPINPEIDTVL